MSTNRFAYAETQNGCHIYINEAERGDKTLVCPFCKYPVVVKKGEKNAHHFAHKAGNPNNHSSESVLHYIAKELIGEMLETGELETHKQNYDIDEVDCKTGRYIKTECTFNSSLFFRDLVEVEVEKTFDDQIRPDILLTRDDGAQIAVEVFVTNKKNLEKINQFKQKELSVIEFDLSELNWNDDFERLKDYIKDTKNQKWLYLSSELFLSKQSYIDKAVQDEIDEEERMIKEFEDYLICDFVNGVKLNNECQSIMKNMGVSSFSGNENNHLYHVMTDSEIKLINRFQQDHVVKNLNHKLTDRVNLSVVFLTKPFKKEGKGFYIGEVGVIAQIKTNIPSKKPKPKLTKLPVYAIQGYFYNENPVDGKPSILIEDHPWLGVKIVWMYFDDWFDLAVKQYGLDRPLRKN